MSEQHPEKSDENLTTLLRAARPTGDLPPGFEQQVWRRIEKAEQPVPGILDLLAQWLLKPRIAAATLAAVVLLAAGVGALRGIQAGNRQALDRYLASVDPAHLQR